MQKATIKELESKGLKLVDGVINNVYFNGTLLNMAITLNGDDADDILISMSGYELAKYYDCYLISAIIDALESVDKTDFVVRANILKKANEEIRNEFLDKTAIVTVQELEPGDPIVQLDGSIYAKDATTDWTKYLLYEWK